MGIFILTDCGNKKIDRNTLLVQAHHHKHGNLQSNRQIMVIRWVVTPFPVHVLVSKSPDTVQKDRYRPHTTGGCKQDRTHLHSSKIAVRYKMDALVT